MEETEMTYEEWLASRPACVQELAKRFPLGSTFMVKGEKHYLMGYTENEDPEEQCLILSPINPSIDYEASKAASIYAHARHFERYTNG